MRLSVKITWAGGEGRMVRWLGCAPLAHMKRPVPSAGALPESIRSRLGDSAGRQRAMLHHAHLLIIAHEPPKPSDTDRRARLFWRQPHGQWDVSAVGAGVGALHRHDEFAKRIDVPEARLHTVDDAEDYFVVLREGTPLHRTVRHLHQALQQAREAVPADHQLTLARDRANDLERADELMIGDAQHGLAYITAKRSGEALARAGHRLDLLAALFLLLTAIAAVFGMSLEHGLEYRWAPWPFWLILMIGMTIGFLFKGAVARGTRRTTGSAPAHTPPAPPG